LGCLHWEDEFAAASVRGWIAGRGKLPKKLSAEVVRLFKALAAAGSDTAKKPCDTCCA